MLYIIYLKQLELVWTVQTTLKIIICLTIYVFA